MMALSPHRAPSGIRELLSPERAIENRVQDQCYNNNKGLPISSSRIMLALDKFL
jgi:hypothetical protein